MPSYHSGQLHVCSFHDASGSAVVNGKHYYWDFSERFGPLFTDSQGRVLKIQPSPRSVRFRAFQKWYDELKAERRQVNGT